MTRSAQDAPAAVQPTAPTGKLMGIWRLGQQLAGGPQWQLWAAQPADAAGNPRWDYVLRTVPRDGSGSAEREAAVARLRRAADAAATARHPQLISVVDASLDGAEPFVVMPRLTGRSLAEILAAGTRQPLPVVLWFVRQAAQACAALHEAGLIHGNLTPENVLISPHGQATVIGLGSARRVSQPTSETQHAAGEAGDSAAAADDVFALGQLLWQLLWLADQDRAPQGSFEATAELVADLIHPDPASRPTCERLVSILAEMETQSLGQLICPGDHVPMARAA